MPWVYRLWMGAALVGYVLGLIRSRVLGPRHPASLPTRVWLSGGAAGVCGALMIVAWLFGSERYQGPALFWVLFFIVFPLIVWGVSAACLGMSQALGKIRLSLSG